MDTKNLTIEKAHESLKNGEYTCRELASAYLKNIEAKNAELNAYLEVFDDVMEQADKAQEMFQNGTATLMTGVPIAIKDNILFKGHKASASSKILENHVATYDSTAVKKLKQAGAIILGRTNMDEFAMGSSTETSAYGITRNPYDLTRVPGGSSGGSAAALGADMALVALGTETCGSVREPSAFCNLVGIKPTYDTFTRHGIIAMGNSLDQVSPFGKSVRDAEIVYNTLVGYDPEDATSTPVLLAEKGKKENMKSDMRRIGVPWHLFAEGVDPEILENFKASIEKFKQAGYEIVDIELPYAKYSLATYYIIMPAEVSTNLSRFDGIRYGLSVPGSNLIDGYKKSRYTGFGKEARRRILLGTYILSHGYYDAYYNKAVKIREKIKEEMAEAFKKVDFITTPTVPVLPFKLGEKLSDPVSMYLCDVFSAPANLTGVPAMALPSGFSKEGLPMSIQFTANNFCEDALFDLGKKFEIM
ncbi:MAG: Asp-tRNA(Asn)/Glu-tRNA(Gln) amidotransferase subunit GatA [Candidatus Pacebacteria bacterium]|nr:Asp-tRNA(Asn)/Glu-tRNA(Gln) amidotransferase subunit GatA [Candidatus Paceibacterota bacterium]